MHVWQLVNIGWAGAPAMRGIGVGFISQTILSSGDPKQKTSLYSSQFTFITIRPGTFDFDEVCVSSEKITCKDRALRDWNQMYHIAVAT